MECVAALVEPRVTQMESLPGQLDRGEHADLSGRHWEAWLRRAGLLVFVAFVALGLANVFGQRPSDSVSSGDAATLGVHAPGALRSGLIYEARFRVDARKTLASPELVLDAGWFDGMTLNSLQPDPAEQSERDGRIVLRYDTVASGESLTVRLQYQVNPTAIGRRTQNVVLEDGGEPIVRIHRDIVVFP